MIFLKIIDWYERLCWLIVLVIYIFYTTVYCRFAGLSFKFFMCSQRYRKHVKSASSLPPVAAAETDVSVEKEFPALYMRKLSKCMLFSECSNFIVCGFIDNICKFFISCWIKRVKHHMWVLTILCVILQVKLQQNWMQFLRYVAFILHTAKLKIPLSLPHLSNKFQ